MGILKGNKKAKRMMNLGMGAVMALPLIVAVAPPAQASAVVNSASVVVADANNLEPRLLWASTDERSFLESDGSYEQYVKGVVTDVQKGEVITIKYSIDGKEYEFKNKIKVSSQYENFGQYISVPAVDGKISDKTIDVWAEDNSGQVSGKTTLTLKAPIPFNYAPFIWALSNDPINIDNTLYLPVTFSVRDYEGDKITVMYSVDGEEHVLLDDISAQDESLELTTNLKIGNAEGYRYVEVWGVDAKGKESDRQDVGVYISDETLINLGITN